MKKYFVMAMGAILISMLSLCCTSSVTRKEIVISAPTPGHDAYYSVARLEAQLDLPGGPSMVATGWAIDARHIVTAGHYCINVEEASVMGVLKGKIKVVSLNRNDELSSDEGAEIVAVDERYDVCVLEMKKHGLIPMKLTRTYKDLRVGDVLRTIGAPMGIFPVETDGHIISTNWEDDDRQIRGKLFVGMPITGGNSGSPVLNAAGEVVGMVVMGTNKYEHVAICTPVWQIRKFLKEELKILY